MVDLLAEGRRLWDGLFALLEQLEQEGYDFESLDEMIKLFDDGVLNPDDYTFPCNHSFEDFKFLVNCGTFDMKGVEKPNYTREFGKPWTYPPEEFIEHYEQGEFKNYNFEFLGGYERHKEMILRGKH